MKLKRKGRSDEGKSRRRLEDAEMRRRKCVEKIDLDVKLEKRKKRKTKEKRERRRSRQIPGMRSKLVDTLDI